MAKKMKRMPCKCILNVYMYIKFFKHTHVASLDAIITNIETNVTWGVELNALFKNN